MILGVCNALHDIQYPYVQQLYLGDGDRSYGYKWIIKNFPNSSKLMTHVPFKNLSQNEFVSTIFHGLPKLEHLILGTDCDSRNVKFDLQKWDSGQMENVRI